MNNYKYKLKGLDCAACARKIEERLNKLDYLSDVNVNFSLMRLTFKSSQKITDKEILNIIQSIEPEVEFTNIENDNQLESKKNIIRLIIGIIISLLGIFFNLRIIILIGYLILLYRTILISIKLLVKSHQINENFLITISCLGAFIINSTKEGLMVITLYEIGKVLENIAINKSRKSISELINIEEEYTNVKNGTKIIKTKTEEVKKGAIIVVKQGEKIPIDGIITKGTSILDTSMITGESKPQQVKKGDNAISGCINKEGLLEIKVTQTYQNSTVKRIMNLVEFASDKKAQTELKVNKFSKTYTMIVIILAILIAIILPIITKNTITTSIYKALIFLVASCPCAIAISVPLSYFSGIGKSSSNGILIKGSNYLDLIKDIDEIVFDKTGTLTKGTLTIKNIEVLDNKYSQDKLKKIIVSGETLSNHPIAISLINYCKVSPDTKNVHNFKEINGKGISFNYYDEQILIGSKTFCHYKGNINSNIFIKINNSIVGYICLEPALKDNAKDTISKLNKLGINTSMLTGDDKISAKNIATKLNINNYQAELLPEDKYNYINNLIQNHKKVAFVGDGINDAPSLVLSTVGISMGGIGTDAAIESSDVVIMNDDISKIITLIEISNKTNTIIKENLSFAIIVKVAVLSLSLFGITGMWQAVFADVGVTIITIFNSLRILKYNPNHK